MRKYLIVLLVALHLADVVSSQPLRVTGVKFLPTGSILVWGETPVNNTLSPAVIIVDGNGRILDAFYFVIPNARGVILDAIAEDEEIVVGGFVERGRRKEAFVARVGNGTVDWAVSIRDHVYFVKALAKRNNGYALFGLSVGLTSGVIDSDIAIVYMDEKASVGSVIIIGCPMYDDFVEKVLTLNESILLIGSTWCQNISYVDTLLVNLTGGTPESIAVGGASYDEGLAVKVLNGKAALVGSSFTSPGGLSDAYLAILGGTDLKVLTVGWQSYDGFADLIGSLADIYLLGYTVIEEKSVGLLVRVNEGKVTSGLLIESDESIVPLSIGFVSEKLITVFKVSNALILVSFDPNLKPLTAFIVGESNLTTIYIRKVKNIEKRVYNVGDLWKAQPINLTLTKSEVSVRALNMEVHPLSAASRPLRIEIGEYGEEVPLTKLLVRTIEQNIPLFIFLLPLLVIVLVVLTARRLR